MRELHAFHVRELRELHAFHVRFSHVRVFSDLRNVQKRATKSVTSGHCLGCTFCLDYQHIQCMVLLGEEYFRHLFFTNQDLSSKSLVQINLTLWIQQCLDRSAKIPLNLVGRAEF